jgi:hypothetical protein
MQGRPGLVEIACDHVLSIMVDATDYEFSFNHDQMLAAKVSGNPIGQVLYSTMSLERIKVKVGGSCKKSQGGCRS